MSLKNVKLSKSRGFTLLEVVMSIALLLTIVTSVTTSLRNSIDIRLSLRAKNKITQKLDVVMHRLNHDISHAFLLDARDHRSDGRKRTLFRIRRVGDSDQLEMTYMGHQPTSPSAAESDISYVVYKLDEWERFSGRKSLFRGELKRIPSIEYRFNDEPPMHLFASNVKSLRIEPWNGDRWVSSGWDSTKSDTENKLPHMVRVVLTAWDDDPEFSGIADDPDQMGLVEYSTVVYLGNALDFNEIRSKVASFRLSL